MFLNLQQQGHREMYKCAFGFGWLTASALSQIYLHNHDQNFTSKSIKMKREFEREWEFHCMSLLLWLLEENPICGVSGAETHLKPWLIPLKYAPNHLLIWSCTLHKHVSRRPSRLSHEPQCTYSPCLKQKTWPDSCDRLMQVSTRLSMVHISPTLLTLQGYN